MQAKSPILHIKINLLQMFQILRLAFIYTLLSALYAVILFFFLSKRLMYPQEECSKTDTRGQLQLLIAG